MSINIRDLISMGAYIYPWGWAGVVVEEWWGVRRNLENTCLNRTGGQ